MTTLDWRKHPRQFYCRCDACLTLVGPLQRRLGKLWQASYGESNTAFHKRYTSSHNSTKNTMSLLTALSKISQMDPVSSTCGPGAPQECENHCIGCVARAAIVDYKSVQNTPSR